MTARIVCGDATALPLPDRSVDAIVCDPPYGLEFMGKDWDAFKPAASRGAGGQFANGTVGGFDGKPMPRHGKRWRLLRCSTCHHIQGGASPCVCLEPQWEAEHEPGTPGFASGFQRFCDGWAAEAFRVLKPGGYLLAFGGSRTWHRLACAVEDAGFELRDSIAWLYGSGFPKSLDVSKALDKAAGVDREAVGSNIGRPGYSQSNGIGASPMMTDDNWRGVGAEFGHIVTAPATDAARKWQGWGTALKPAHEPVVCARKPLDAAGILVEIGSHLDRLEQECQAQAAAHGTPTGAVDDSPAQTATSPSESATPTSSNIVSSWRTCWAETCSLLSTSTTATVSETTTALRTLNSSLSRLTATNMHPSGTSRPGLTSIASAADHLFASVVCGLRATLALSATEPVTGDTQPSRPDGAAPARPAFEPIVVARKPLVGTVAANVQQHGTGALNIDGCRTATTERLQGSTVRNDIRGGRFAAGHRAADDLPAYSQQDAGRWPTNVVLSHGDCADGCELGCPVAALDQQSGISRDGVATNRNRSEGRYQAPSCYGEFATKRGEDVGYGGQGGASRFFPTFRYQAKAPTRERPVGPDGIKHPTCKPLDLMRWLVRLVTPPGGIVLDMFAGSGTTLEAAQLEGFAAIGVEKHAPYLPLIVQRLERSRIAPTVETDWVLDLFGDAA